jgi:hypothetical protein
VQVIPKTNEAKHRIQKALEKSYLFTSLDKDQIHTVLTTTIPTNVSHVGESY